MKVVFLIGNGFDLNCGLKSSYNDMYMGYCNSKSNTENIKRFKAEINHDISKWSDFEKSIGEYGLKVDSADVLLECIRDFKKYLASYLKNECRAFDNKFSALDNYWPIIKEFQDSIDSFYIDCGFPMSLVRKIDEMKKQDEMEVSIINFNYTNTIELIDKQIISPRRRIGEIEMIHIHGELVSDDIVLGVDNINQVHADYKIHHRLERGIVKSIFNDEYDNDKISRINKLIGQADIICSFGMSFGITDNTWKKKIIESMLDNKEQIFVFYDYEMSKKEGLVIDQRMDECDEYKQNISTKWELDIPGEVLDRIYVPCGKNIFNINQEINEILQEMIRAQEQRAHIVKGVGAN